MKHRIADDVNVNLNVEFDKDDVIEVVHHLQVAAVTVIVASTVGHILKTILK